MDGRKRDFRSVCEKLALIHRLDLPKSDIINLLIGGIMQSSLRATALTLMAASIDQFLETMRRITHGVGDLKKRNSSPSKDNKFKDVVCRGCGKRGHGLQRDCKAAELSCVYCKGKGHTRTECQKLLRKNQAAATTSSPVPAAKAASVAHPTTAAIAENCSDKFILSVPIVKIIKVGNNDCSVSALMDTGSPVSFISLNNFRKLLGLTEKALEPVISRFNALPKTPIDVLGKFNSTVVFEYFPDQNFTITFHVIATDFSDLDMIIGRDLMDNHNLTLIYNASKASLDPFTSLLPQQMFILPKWLQKR